MTIKENVKKSCEEGNGNLIIKKQNTNVGGCRELCDNANKCNYFYSNSKEWCLTFKKCDALQARPNKGTTYMKKGKTHDKYTYQTHIFPMKLIIY